MILDVEATEIEAEKQEAEWTYNHVQGYMPLVGYVEGVCVGYEFREDNQSPGARIVDFARSCEGALPEGKKIYFRSDSAAYQGAVINHYSRPGRRFSITADQDAAVKGEIQNLPEARIARRLTQSRFLGLRQSMAWGWDRRYNGWKDPESSSLSTESKVMNEHMTTCALGRPSNTLDPPSERRF